MYKTLVYTLVTLTVCQCAAEQYHLL